MKRFFTSELIVRIDTPTQSYCNYFPTDVKVSEAVDFMCKTYLIPEDSIIKLTSSFVRNYKLGLNNHA